MKSKSISISLMILFSSFLFLNPIIQNVYGSVGCAVSVSPSSVKGGATTAVNFTILNLSDSETLVYGTIGTTSVDEFQVQSFQADGWSTTVDGTNHIAFSEGTIAPNESKTFAISVKAIDQDQSTIAWTVTAGDSPDGGGQIECTGNPGIGIYKSTVVSGLSISSIGATDVSSTRATIDWTTNNTSDSLVEYGKSTAYGASKSNGDLVSNHSVIIDSLDAGTTYHFRAKSTDNLGNSVVSDDFSFTTLSGSQSSSTITTVPSSLNSNTTPTLSPFTDLLPPTVHLTTKLTNPYETAPKIEGDANDNVGVSKLEYSLDRGKNWIQIQNVTSKKGKYTFSFTPPNDLDDGNYSLVVRATDPSGNHGVTMAQDIVIDRIPPRIGPFLLHVGPLLLEPTSTGAYEIPTDTLTSLSFSAVGGPISIVLRVGDQTFQAHKFVNSGLWKATFSVKDPGSYDISATATDGAGNVTSRKITTVVVRQNGAIHLNSKAESTITVFVKPNAIQDFTQWDGSPYGIKNPIDVHADGSYSLILPAGEYYLRITSQGYKPLVTSIFTLTKPFIIDESFTLHPAQTIQIGPFRLDWLNVFQAEAVTFAPGGQTTHADITSSLLKKEFPSINGINLRGKPTIVIVLNSWSPFSESQMEYLQTLSPKDVRVVALYSQESEQTVLLVKSRISNTIYILTDKDGSLTQKLDVDTVPTHFFINSNGIVTKMTVGVLTGKEIMTSLIH